MSKPLTIPPEAFEAAKEAYIASTYERLDEDALKVACLALLSAWPKMYVARDLGEYRVILPFPQEKP
jgi:hypothetical protein